MLKKTVTARILLRLDYVCSKCGAKNQAKDQIRSSVNVGYLTKTDSYLQEMEERAEDQFHRLFLRVPYNRFSQAQLSCRCGSCGHREPWARLRYRLLFLATYFGAVAAMVGAVLYFTDGLLWGLPIFLLGGGVAIWSLVHKPIHSRIMKKELEQLPPASIPKVYYSNGGRWYEIVPRTEATANSWICTECGEISPKKLAFCTECGTQQAWSENKRLGR